MVSNEEIQQTCIYFNPSQDNGCDYYEDPIDCMTCGKYQSNEGLDEDALMALGLFGLI
ncbi:hypothetical protein [uncultured Methanobrevibacter sp.]|uniref:hypothetical protein n=1 Tax=uncultured Methanobrevibacter sp. TaxID=253161 RepID=UPI0025FAC32E|nr:hypothetical protein [uncultured Methanobrevibacter sp.]